MLMDKLGQCRYCDYEPIANTARFCPKCGGTNPHESDFPMFRVGFVLLIAAAAAVGYLLYLA